MYHSQLLFHMIFMLFAYYCAFVFVFDFFLLCFLIPWQRVSTQIRNRPRLFAKILVSSQSSRPLFKGR